MVDMNHVAQSDAKMQNQYLLSWQYLIKVKLATVVEGDPKAPFSIAATPSCR